MPLKFSTENDIAGMRCTKCGTLHAALGPPYHQDGDPCTVCDTQPDATDQEKLVALLSEFGVEMLTCNTTVQLQARTKGVVGYLDMFAEFEFDQQGKFVQIGLWE